MKTKPVDKAVHSEFVAYWQPDELPNFNDEAALSERARETATRLRRAVGDDQVAALRAYLEAAQADPNHALLSNLANSPGIAWMDDPADWANWQRLVELIKRDL